MPLIKYTKILAQEESHFVFVGTFNGFRLYKLKENGCNFMPLDKTWWHLEAWSIGHRTYRLSKRSDHSRMLFQLDIDKFNAEYERLPS